MTRDLKSRAKTIVRAVFGYLIWDDRGGTPIPGLPPRAPWWYRLWWGDEDFPMWLNTIASWLRRLWYRGKSAPCTCPGCTRLRPAWWSTRLCWSCAHEDCDHNEENEIP